MITWELVIIGTEIRLYAALEKEDVMMACSASGCPLDEKTGSSHPVAFGHTDTRGGALRARCLYSGHWCMCTCPEQRCGLHNCCLWLPLSADEVETFEFDRVRSTSLLMESSDGRLLSNPRG